MDVGADYNNQLDIQSLLLNGVNNIYRANNSNVKINDNANYAKKGEPMYMAEMDADDDGIVTLDEYKEYCKTNNISTKQMVKMSQMASLYRTMKAESETIDYISKFLPNISPKLKQADSESSYVKNAENKYNISSDSAHDNNVSYKEYMEYCEQHSIQNELKSNTKYEEDKNGILKITNSGKAVTSYKNGLLNTVKNTFENVV